MGYNAQRRASLCTPPSSISTSRKRKADQDLTSSLSSPSSVQHSETASILSRSSSLHHRRSIIKIHYPNTPHDTNHSEEPTETPFLIEPSAITRTYQLPSTPKAIKRINKASRLKITTAIMAEKKKLVNKPQNVKEK